MSRITPRRIDELLAVAQHADASARPGGTERDSPATEAVNKGSIT